MRSRGEEPVDESVHEERRCETRRYVKECTFGGVCKRMYTCTLERVHVHTNDYVGGGMCTCVHWNGYMFGGLTPMCTCVN